MHITLVNKIENMESVHSQLKEYLYKLSVDKEFSKKISILVDEVLSNIIFYGYEDNLEHVISLKLVPNQELLHFEFIDDGKYFNPIDYIHQRSNLPREDKAGGLGLDLVFRLAHSLNYLRKDDKNILTIIMTYHHDSIINK